MKVKKNERPCKKETTKKSEHSRKQIRYCGKKGKKGKINEK
jgi:hypothetical protein